MAEFDTIPLFNPLTEQFMVRFNGEPYILQPKETTYFPKGLAFHIAKHLSERLLAPKQLSLKEKTGREENPLVGQLINYDNVDRRIALFDILGKVDVVESCIKACNLKGFIGNISEYDDYVSKKTGIKVASATPVKADIPIVNSEPTPLKKEPAPEPTKVVEPPKEDMPPAVDVPPTPPAPDVQTPRRGRPANSQQKEGNA